MNKLRIENRIAKLSTNPVQNAKLIKKWKRALRRELAKEQNDD